jgi:hypothetical protein
LPISHGNKLVPPALSTLGSRCENGKYVHAFWTGVRIECTIPAGEIAASPHDKFQLLAKANSLAAFYHQIEVLTTYSCLRAAAKRPSFAECYDLAEVMGVVDCDMRDRVSNSVVRQRWKLDWRIDTAYIGGLITSYDHGLIKAFHEPLTHRLPFASRGRRPTE